MSFPSIFGNHYRRNAWIATYLQFLIMGLVWLLASFFRRANTTGTGALATGPNPSMTEAGAASTPTGYNSKYAGPHPFHWRAKNAERFARWSFLLSFFVVVMTDSGFGITRSVNAILWTMLGLQIIGMIGAASTTRTGWVQGLIGLPLFVIAAVAAGLAFRG